ncbi:MAG TPA: peptidylprolyl isomerase [Usitatibacter sp.]|nr:peptidylprolyl isomerase [Usitatibacter sp.]
MKNNRIAFAAAAFALAVPFASAAQSTTPACDAALNTAAPKVRLTTSMGPIVLQLDREKAPLSTENFVKYVGSGHYDGTVFHRVIDNFMVQGGGFDKDMREKPTRGKIKNEASNGLKNDAYTVAMARTNEYDSATSQFFINSKANDFLNYQGPNTGYAVFGKVVEGRETVDKIRKVAVQQTRYSEATPNEAVLITKAECIAPAAK